MRACKFQGYHSDVMSLQLVGSLQKQNHWPQLKSMTVAAAASESIGAALTDVEEPERKAPHGEEKDTVAVCGAASYQSVCTPRNKGSCFKVSRAACFSTSVLLLFSST